MKFKTVGDIKIHPSEFCKPCNQNLTVDNGFVIYGDQTAFVKCSEGFKIEGNPFVYCLRTSKWEVSKMPTCKIVKCSPLKTPSNGRLSLTKISYSGRAKFTCDDGFTLIGNETIICMANGNWSDEVPDCKSDYECSSLRNPKNGALIYASDSGVINEKPSYPVGTFVQVKCSTGFAIEGDNFMSCSDQGEWDSEVEDCEAEVGESTTVEPIEKEKILAEFWRDWKQYLFYSCSTEDPEGKPKFCSRFTSTFNSDLTTFELPETKEYEGMGSKLLKLLNNLQISKEFDSLTVENFITNLLGKSITDKTLQDSFRFVICLYIDLIILDEELYDEESSEDVEKIGNINENIKSSLKKVALPIYKNQLIT